MTTFTFALVLVAATGIGLYSRIGMGKKTEDFLVGGRSFGVVLTFVLGVGETYSIGTIIGFPGGVYLNGSSYAVWFMGYILLGLASGYFLLPVLWRAGRVYGAMTAPDMLKAHFKSRSLELTAALVGIVFLIPWAQLQLTGLTVALQGLGLHISEFWAVVLGVVLAIFFTLLSGIRAPAYVSIIKDIGLILAVIVVAVAALSAESGNAAKAVTAAANSGKQLIGSGSPMTFAITTILFQAVGFYMFPFAIQAILSSRRASVIKRTSRLMPLYMLMYPFLVIAAFFAVAQFPNLTGTKSNLAFMEVAKQVLPEWVVGLVAGIAALCAIIVLVGSSLSIGTLISRNVVPHIPEAKQKNVVKICVALYLLISIVVTIEFPSIMVGLINTAYFGITQVVVPVALMMVRNRVRPIIMAVGLAVSCIAALVLFATDMSFGGVNLGLICLAINIAIVGIGRLVWPAVQPNESLWQRFDADRKQRLPQTAATTGERA